MAASKDLAHATTQAGRVLDGRYQLLSLMAAGGMGAVYEARHLITKKPVAVKVMHAHIAKDQAAKERFLREARAPAVIGHPNIVDITDAGIDRDDGTLFLCMELLTGRSFRGFLQRPEVTQMQALERVLDLLEPLAAAHRQGFVHRDLKPDNIFISLDDYGIERVKLLDFGIARHSESHTMTSSGIAMGTVHYMAPEQARDAQSVTTAADVWSIGIMLYEIVVGVVPFPGATFEALLKVASEPHRAVKDLVPNVPAELEALIDHCLEKDPAARPVDAAALAEELESVMAAVAGEWEPTDRQTSHTRRKPRAPAEQGDTTSRIRGDGSRGRRRTLLLVATAAVVVTAAGALAGWIVGQEMDSEPVTEERVTEPTAPSLEPAAEGASTQSDPSPTLDGQPESSEAIAEPTAEEEQETNAARAADEPGDRSANRRRRRGVRMRAPAAPDMESIDYGRNKAPVLR